MADKGRLSYALQKSDTSLAEVAQRYETTVTEIWKATVIEPGRLRNLSKEEFFEKMRAGDTLYVPYAGDPWEWRVVTLKTRTLKEYCDKKPDPARTGAPRLTPQLLWFYLVNAGVRDVILRRQPDVEAQRKLDQDPGSVPLQPDDQFFVPYPIPNRAPAVKATRSTDASPGVTVETAPEWITALRALDKQVSSLVEQLTQLTEKCEALAMQGRTAVLHVTRLTQMVTLAAGAERFIFAPSASLNGLQQAMGKLTAEASDLLFANPAEKVWLSEDATRRALAKKLNKIMHGDDLSRCTLLAALSPKERVGGESVVQISDRIFARATEALAMSYEAPEALRDIDAGYHAFMRSRSVDPASGENGDTGSVITAYISAANGAIGNLPGPSSLGVALVLLWTRRKIPEFAKEGAEYVKKAKELTDKSFDSHSIFYGGKETTAELEAAAQNAQKLADAGTRGRQQLIDYGKLDAEELVILEAALANADDKVALKRAAEMIAGKTHSSTKWHGAMAALNFIALGLAIQHVIASKGSLSAADVLNVGGGISGSVAGGLQFLVSVYKLPANSKVLIWAKGVGAFGLVVSIVNGYITVRDTSQSTIVRTGGGMQVAGGLMSLIGLSQTVPQLELACLVAATPGLQFFGAALLIASTAVSAWPMLKELSVPQTKKVLLAQLYGLSHMQVWQQMVVAQPYLDVCLQNVLTRVNAPDDGGLVDFDCTAQNAAALRVLGFQENDILSMTSHLALPDSSYADPY